MTGRTPNNLLVIFAAAVIFGWLAWRIVDAVNRGDNGFGQLADEFARLFGAP